MTVKQKKFIVSLRDTNDIEKACEDIGITKRTFYNWCKNNKEFRKKTEVKKDNKNISKIDLKSIFLVAYKNNLNISASCDETGISRGTFYNWIKHDDEFKFNVGSINESVIDRAESVIHRAMTETDNNGNPTKKAVDTAKFILSQKGIKRGWGEKIQTEITMTPWEKAEETKRLAELEVIDVTPEEIRKMIEEKIEEDKGEVDVLERLKEMEFLNSLTEYEKIEYEKDPAEFMKKKVLDEIRFG